MKKPNGKIFETLDYQKFQVLKGNRLIKENKELEQSIRESGILVPVEVNENFEILDGQVRVKIAKKLKIPVPYRIAAGLTIDDVIDLNSTTKNWNVSDYIRKYTVEGKASYVKLSRLLREFAQVPTSSLIAAAMGYTKVRSSVTNKTKHGDFEFLNYEEFYEVLRRFAEFLEESGIKCSQQIFFAYFELYITPNFQESRLINGFKKMDKRQIEGVFHKGIVLEFLLKAHNYGLGTNSQSAIKYKLNQDGNPIILEERNSLLIKE